MGNILRKCSECSECRKTYYSHNDARRNKKAHEALLAKMRTGLEFYLVKFLDKKIFRRKSEKFIVRELILNQEKRVDKLNEKLGNYEQSWVRRAISLEYVLFYSFSWDIY